MFHVRGQALFLEVNGICCVDAQVLKFYNLEGQNKWLNLLYETCFLLLFLILAWWVACHLATEAILEGGVQLTLCLHFRKHFSEMLSCNLICSSVAV